MGKILTISGIVLLVLVLIITIVSICNNSDDSNDLAEKDTEERYLTIINNTDQIINEVRVTVGEGTEIEDMYRKNPDKKSFSIEIPKQYSEYNTFTVTLIDRYDMIYKREITNVKEHGRTEVKISKENYVEERGDFLNNIDKFFNGD